MSRILSQEIKTKNIEENTQSQKQNPHSGMLQKLQTTLNPNFLTPQNRVRRPRTSTQINNVQEYTFNTSIISDKDTPASIQEALHGTIKEAWKLSARSEIENFLKRGS